ncbi:MAG: hypothetical protein Q6373_000845 [Candidatus Sigynarchaeota archaeon]
MQRDCQQVCDQRHDNQVHGIIDHQERDTIKIKQTPHSNMAMIHPPSNCKYHSNETTRAVKHHAPNELSRMTNTIS